MTAKILTQSRLKELLHYDPDTGIFTWLVSAGCVKIGSIAGKIDPSNGYLRFIIDKNKYLAHRLAWLYMTGEFPKEQNDHINHIRDDNRWLNLRAVSHAENSKNRKLQKNNTSGMCGVGWHKSSNKWHALIKHKKKIIRLGFFTELADAISARQAAEVKYGFHENHGKR